MIENKLTFSELRRILRPVIRLESLSSIFSEYNEVFPSNLQSLNAIQNYTQLYNVTYREFKVIIKGLGKLSENSIYISIDFRLDKKWYHQFKNPTEKIIEDLKIICLKELKELYFSKYSTVVYDQKVSYKKPERNECLFYYDGRALNSEWNQGSEISPLLITPSNNEKYYFVEFYYNSNCYFQNNKEISLKADWRSHIQDVNKYLQTEVDKFFNNNET